MDKNKLSGWYYDLQTEYDAPTGRMSCITLHPSTAPSSDVEWPSEDGDADQGFYSPEPVAIALINEDFQVSIANTWSDFGGDPIGGLWDTVRPLAPYAGYAEDMMEKLTTNYNNAKAQRKIKENSLSKSIGDAVNQAWGWYKDHTKGGGASAYLNMALVAMGTRFSYYAGTGISFGSMVMKYYVMPRWDGTTFVSVTEQLELLYPYIMGHLMLKEKKANDPDQLIAWQQGPGGFKSDYRDIDTEQKGTLLMKYGGLYAINNLVVEQANLVFSRQAVK